MSRPWFFLSDLTALGADQKAEWQAWRLAVLIAWGTLVLALIVNATSIQLEDARSGGPTAALYPWFLEGSSVVITMALVPLIMRFGLWAPLESGRWLTALPWHIGGLLTYNILHVIGMVALRKLAWWAWYDGPYVFFGHVWLELVYELRKDAFTYMLHQLILIGTLALARSRLELAAARDTAREGQRLTLKSGGRVIRVEAALFSHAQAQGNYVEIHFTTGQHLVRMTLAQLADQLAEARIPAVRCHRSWLVHTGRIREILPTGEGDARVRLDDDVEIPASRRYRERLQAA